MSLQGRLLQQQHQQQRCTGVSASPCKTFKRPGSLAAALGAFKHYQVRVGEHSQDAIKERIRIQFEGRAAMYDTDNSYHPPLAQKLLELCQLQQGQRFLDLACGTGLLALSAAATVGPTGLLAGVDLSPAMLQRARDKAAAQGLTNTQFTCGDIEQLQQCLPSTLTGSFDAAACSAASPFLTEPQQTLASWKPWLKGGGRLAFNAFVPPALQGYDVFVSMAREQYGLVEECDPAAALGSIEKAEAALQAAGYKSIQVVSETKQRLMPASTPIEHAEKIWQMGMNVNPFRSVKDIEAKLGPEKLAAFKDDFLAAIAHSLDGSDRFDPHTQLVTSTYTVLHVVATA